LFQKPLGEGFVFRRSRGTGSAETFSTQPPHIFE
jgi:hypothetical protein